MNEFINRIDAQRQILQLVNVLEWENEELFGLSAKAIDRWISANHIVEPKLIALLSDVAAKLFFLANKSQEQITLEYRSVSQEVDLIAKAIESEISRLRKVVPR